MSSDPAPEFDAMPKRASLGIALCILIVLLGAVALIVIVIGYGLVAVL